MKYMTSRAHHLRSCSMVKTDDRRVLSSRNPIMLMKIQSPLNPLLSPLFSILWPQPNLGLQGRFMFPYVPMILPSPRSLNPYKNPMSPLVTLLAGVIHPFIQPFKPNATSGEAPLLLLQLLLQVGLLRVQALNPDTSTRVQSSRKLVPDRTYGFIWIIH